MSKKKGNYLIPFDEDGNQVFYDNDYYITERRENLSFNDTLTYSHYNRGRSAAHLIFLASDGTKRTMFLTDFDDLIKNYSIDRGTVNAKWIYVKRGSNYGIKLYTEEN